MKIDKFSPAIPQCVFVGIDFQEKLTASMPKEGLDRVLNTAAMAIQGFSLLGVPIIETRQYPKGLGDTVKEIKMSYPEESICVDKTSFSVYDEPEFIAALGSIHEKDTVILAGIETHICILQTAVSLLTAGYNVHIIEDACMARSYGNHLSGIAMMRDAGAVITNVETILFQMIRGSTDQRFKDISKLVKERKY